MNKLIEFLQRILEWVIDLLLWVPRKIWELMLDGLASLVEAIPVPDFMDSLTSYVGDVDSAVAYFTAPLQVAAGASFILTALVIRFAIRRIPVIG